MSTFDDSKTLIYFKTKGIIKKIKIKRDFLLELKKTNIYYISTKGQKVIP